MIPYKEITLKDMLEEVGEEEVKRIISDFSCSKDGKSNLNNDVEFFLKEKAILYERALFSRTCLIFASGTDNKLICVGYYSLAQKEFTFTKDVSKAKKKEIAGHHTLLNQPIPAMLLGQLGKNFSDKALKGSLITGKDLINMAFKRMKIAYNAVPFKFIYLECKDNLNLRTFYEKHSFELHKDKNNEPYKNDSNLLIYVAPATLLEYV